ncbi:hypothetical protein ACT453_38060, partial [Bacillus sp. D-CC]
CPSRTAFSSIKSPPGKSGTTWLTSFALVRIPSRLIAKKRAKERRSLSANGQIAQREIESVFTARGTFR